MAPQNPLLIIFVVFVVYGVLGLLYYLGIEMIIEGGDYAANWSSEKCTITDYETEECFYNCQCNSKADFYVNGSRSACARKEPCRGKVYSYLAATAETKCSNQTLFLRQSDIECPMTLKQIDSVHDCLILDCDDGQFTFTNPATAISSGVAVVVFASFCTFAPCCAIYFSKYISKWCG